MTLEIAAESIQRRVVLYDKEGDYHFDTISTFIKSLRGSDPEAALYRLASMVYAGEYPCFIFRRMLIFASEEMDLSDLDALVLTVVAAAAAFERIRLPEGRFNSRLTGTNDRPDFAPFHWTANTYCWEFYFLRLIFFQRYREETFFII